MSEFQRVRILHVVTSSVSAVFMRGQLSYLRDKGFDVFLASAPGPDLKRVCDEEQVQEITIAITREISPLRDVIALFRLWRLILNIKPSITNVSTPKAGLLGGIAAFAARVPVRVYTLRGLRLETARGLKRSVLMMMERIACGSAHHVRCVGASVRDRAIQLKLVGSKKAYVLGRGSSNGVDFELFRKSGKSIAEARALRLQFKIPDSAPVIGFVGRFTRDKGIAELYRAFQQVKESFPDTRLLLVGDFEEGDPVDAAVRQGLETEPGVIFAGMVKDTPRYYAAMDVLALPTYREGFPNVPLEAQAASVPVVTTRVTGAVDSVIDGVTGRLIPAQDADALAEALIELLSRPEKRKKMGKMAAQWVEDRFRRELVWEELVKDYRRILQKPFTTQDTEEHEERELPLMNADDADQETDRGIGTSGDREIGKASSAGNP